MSMVKEAVSGLELESFNLCVACSGGLDSTVLLEVLVHLGYKPLILHVNYQLRGEESDKDETFVHELAEKHQLEIEVVRCPVEVTKGKGINLQEAARKFRHELFQSFIQRSPNNRVLLAHHQDDQIETFFLQLLRGSGLFGLGGMHRERNGIIRPFLEITKSDLKRFAIDRNIEWREDASNQENHYKRNQLRNVLIPQMLESNPELTDSVKVIQKAFRETQEELQTALSPKLETWKKQAYISFEEWTSLTLEEQIVCCYQFKWPFWIIERIRELKDAKLSAKIDNSPIFKTKDGFSWNSNFADLMQWEFKIEEVEFLPENFNHWEAYLDPGKCKGPIKQDIAGPADIIWRIGVKGKSSVFKLLKDSGIPEQWRKTYPVFKSGEEIIWIPGIAISKNHTAHQATSLIIKLYKV
ncbi:MAG: tRNA(Ile)-lysidine synthase [Fluviicola sp.]|jgi:tRNA(Ile)-lysidine synthase|uniref:tRNA lysidine(34) synthetase TilS n=1 Tax=Fluviicola sp. TaxID=1917219 RepID=UPI00262EBF7C|nr:tRNA lysidine(34) synthetase TilS [Fluviicola sp.]MDF3027189.1 tRNA(Ile)-lysidine synthase [Fluviicola sp.]